MYRLLIVDDERSIRNGIANSIDWKELGFEVVGLAKDGVQAVEMLSLEPDVVISDIRMPRMDGVELMKYLNKNHPDIKIIILSGYNDYEYLNMSIKNQVTDYLLKPTDVEAFEALFRRIKIQLDQKREEKKKLEIYKDSYEMHQKERLYRKLRILLHAYVDCDEAFVDEVENNMGVSFTECRISVFMLDEKQMEGSTGKAILEVRDEAVELLNRDGRKDGYFFFLSGRDLIGIFGIQWYEQQEIGRKAEQLKTLLNQTYQVETSIGISGPCGGADEFFECYEEARGSALQKMFIGNGNIIFAENVQPYMDVQRKHEFDVEILKKMIMEGEEDHIGQIVEEKFRFLQQAKWKDIRYVDYGIFHLVFQMMDWYGQYDASIEDVLGNVQVKYERIRCSDSLQERKKFLLDMLLLMSRRTVKFRENQKKSNTIGNLVKEYIDKEYMNNAISLEFLAEKLNKNAVYISKVFKMETGYNFSEYLTRKRIEKSRELLQDPKKKVYEIAAMVGYVNVSNFIKVFKKQTGWSPNDYRIHFGGVYHEEH